MGAGPALDDARAVTGDGAVAGDTHGVLADLDTALRSLLGAVVPGARIRGDVPEPGWDAQDGEPTLGVFLHHIEEDVTVRQASWSDVRDEHGEVYTRRAPARRYRFCYVVTSWAATDRERLVLLGAVLTELGSLLTVPAAVVPVGPLRAGPPVTVDVANPDLPGAQASLWHAWGMAPRAALDVVLTAMSPPVESTALDRVPTEIDLGSAAMTPDPPVSRPGTGGPVAAPADQVRPRRRRRD